MVDPLTLRADILAAIDVDPLTIRETAVAVGSRAPIKVAGEMGRLCGEGLVAAVDPAAKIRHYLAVPFSPNQNQRKESR